jgi:hypothetical protein
MKKILIIISLLTAKEIIAQDTLYTHFIEISYISPNKDTLILPNDSFGKMLRTTWNDIQESERPVIILESEEEIRSRNQAIKTRREFFTTSPK